jgi:hypothetical protein
MKQVIAVICTLAKTIEEFQNKHIYKTLEKLHGLYGRENFDVRIVKDNKRGLSEVYNEFINKDEFSNKILLFVHDDVELNDLFLVEKLNESPYVVTGLAGSKTCNLGTAKLAWHLATNKEDMVGEVAHKKEEYTWTTVFGPTRSRSLIIDGLFIAVDVEKIKNTSARFNEKFKFHHYDMAFSLECNKHKVTVGVLPIHVIHHGMGDSMLSNEWNESNEIFKKEYKRL